MYPTQQSGQVEDSTDQQHQILQPQFYHQLDGQIVLINEHGSFDIQEGIRAVLNDNIENNPNNDHTLSLSPMQNAAANLQMPYGEHNM